jgi:hypothetical protein
LLVTFASDRGDGNAQGTRDPVNRGRTCAAPSRSMFESADWLIPTFLANSG